MKRRSTVEHGNSSAPAATSTVEQATSTVDVSVPAAKKMRVCKDKLPTLRTRMSPAGLYNFLRDKKSPPSEQQLQAITEMGFGGLLKIETDKVPGALSYWIASNYNPIKGWLFDKNLPILEEDIYLTLGIPIGSRVVEEASNVDKDPTYLSTVADFKSQYPHSAIDVKDILNKMSTQKDGGDDFKRNFIIYIFSSFLGGIKGSRASLKLLKNLADTSVVSEYNWCNFIKRKLADQVESWQKEEFAETKTVKDNWFGGPIMVLVYIYLDRYVCKSRLVSRQFPTCSTWTKAKIAKRINLELKLKNDFGQGFVEPPLVISHHQPIVPHPKVEQVISSKSAVHVQEQTDCKSAPISDIPPHVDNGCPGNSKGDIIHRLAESAKAMAAAFSNYKSLAIQATEQLPSSAAVSNLVAAVDGIADGYHSSQQTDLEEENVGDDANVDVGNEEENIEVVNKDVKEAEDDADMLDKLVDSIVDNMPCPLDNAVGKEDPVNHDVAGLLGWSEADVQAALGVMDEAFEPIRPREARVPIKRMRKRHKPRVPTPPDFPSYRLLAKDDHFLSSQDYESCSDPASQPTPAPPVLEHPVIVVSDSPTVPSPAVIELADTPVVRPPSPKSCPKPKPAVPLPVQRMVTRLYVRRRGDCLAGEETIEVPRQIEGEAGTSFPILTVPSVPDDVDVNTPAIVRSRRSKYPAAVYRSPYLQRNISILLPFSRAEKQLLDFLLNPSLVQRDVVYRSSTQSLTRGMMRTIVEGDRVCDEAVNVWCEILNSNERLKSPDSPFRLFVPYSDDSVSLDKIDLSVVQLICTPIVSPSCPPFFFCFDLRQNKLTVVHPMKGIAVNYSDYVQPTKDKIVNQLSARFRAVVDMVPELFIAPSVLKSGEMDTGVYLFHMLEHYKGNKNGCPLVITSASQLKRYAFKLCVRIIASDDNLAKADVDDYVEELHRIPIGTRFLPYSDASLVNFVNGRRRGDDGKYEAMVSTEWMEVTLAGLQTLRPRQFVMDQVIDMFGIKMTVGRPDLLYLPSTVANCRLKKNPSIWNNYIKDTYCPADGSQIRKVFFTLNNESHWWACVCDLEDKQNYILNSGTKFLGERARDITINTVFNASGFLTSNTPSYYTLKFMHASPFVDLSVPQQTNIHDCGVHVLKYLSMLDDGPSHWINPANYKGMAAFRTSVMLELLKWDANTRTVFE